MKIKTFEFNPISENTYILYDNTKECAIIDAGCFFPPEKEALVNFIKDNQLTVKCLLNTHLHFDHVFGNNFIFDQFGLKTQAHKGDEFLLEQMATQLRMFGFKDTGENAPQIGKYLTESDTIIFGNQRLSILHVPGHSMGSLVFYNKEAGCLFCGDVLFQESIGRTDLAGGNHQQLIEGIKEKLLTLPPGTSVYPGHGPSTSIGYEIENNPYLR